MIKLNIRCRLALAVGLVAGLVAVQAFGEQQTKASGAPSTEPAATVAKAKPQRALTLSDVTRVDTNEAAHRAAENMAGAHAKAGDAKVDGKASTASPGVVEFQPAGSDARGSAKPLTVQDGKSKAPLKNVHGSVYGALGAGGHEDAASVGASSKGGKTSVYVETDQSHPRE